MSTKRKRKRCIWLWRPHRWHWYAQDDHTGRLTVRCGRCYKLKEL